MNKSLGCINIYASLLPRWRGAAPIQRSILEGDQETGISIMKMDEGLDTGPVFYQVSCPIEHGETSESLHDKLAVLGAKALMHTLNLIESGQSPTQPQDSLKATYASKLQKEEGCLNWLLSAEELDRRIRAFYPWPVAFTHVENETIRIWRAEVLSNEQMKLAPGTILSITQGGIDVACGKGILKILELQLSGGRRMSVADFLNAPRVQFKMGKILGKMLLE